MTHPARGEQAHAEIELAARRRAEQQAAPAAEPESKEPTWASNVERRLWWKRRCLAWERRYRELAEAARPCCELERSGEHVGWSIAFDTLAAVLRRHEEERDE